jgi:hypothetical protein
MDIMKQQIYQGYCNTYLFYSFSFYDKECESVAAVCSQPLTMLAALVYQLGHKGSTVREKKICGFINCILKNRHFLIIIKSYL